MWTCGLLSALWITLSTTGSSVALQPHTTARGEPSVVNESYALLDVIKQNLRRNNDDYDINHIQSVEPVVTHRAVGAETPFIRAANHDTAAPSGNVGRLLGDFVPLTRSNHDKNSTIPKNKKHKRVENNGQKGSAVNPAGQHSPGRDGSKWKRGREGGKRPAQLSNRTGPGASTEPRDLRMLRDSVKLRSRASSLMDLFPIRTQGPERAPPDADQLDMAPARGARVQHERAGGRLCQRHVLWLEGPKYDSRGNTVMPLYRPQRYHGKDFPHTSKPLLVLPRCCNCCKKSVLGCQ